MDEKLRALARKEVVDVRVVDVARACLRERVRALVGDVKTPYEEMLERIEEYNAGLKYRDPGSFVLYGKHRSRA